MPDPANQQPSVEGATSDRQEDPNMPAPPSPSDQQVGREAREVPPQQQEDSSSGKATTGERKDGRADVGPNKETNRSSSRGRKGKDSSKSSHPPAVGGKDDSKRVSKPPTGPSSTYPEGGKAGSSGFKKDQKSAVSNNSKIKNTPISPIKTNKTWK